PVGEIYGSENSDSILNGKSEDHIFPNLNAYVIQGGVFEEKSSVNDWKSSFQDAAFSPIVWQRNGKYYLFVGIAKTKEQANALVTDIVETYGLDVFAKEWHTNEAELNLNQEEQKWMDTVIKLWNDSLLKIDGHSDFPLDDWKSLGENLPEENEHSSFNEK